MHPSYSSHISYLVLWQFSFLTIFTLTVAAGLIANVLSTSTTGTDKSQVLSSVAKYTKSFGSKGIGSIGLTLDANSGPSPTPPAPTPTSSPPPPPPPAPTPTSSPPPPTPPVCYPKRTVCSSDGDCCSKKCRGKTGSMECK